MSFDRKKPHAIVSGYPGVQFEQNGRLYDAAGRDVNEQGDLVKPVFAFGEMEPVAADSQEPAADPLFVAITATEMRSILTARGVPNGTYMTKKKLAALICQGNAAVPAVIEQEPETTVSAPVELEAETNEFDALRSKFEVDQ